MSNVNSLLEGFASALTLTNLGFGLLGTLLGTLVGVLPGIGPALAIALLLPITYTVAPSILRRRTGADLPSRAVLASSFTSCIEFSFTRIQECCRNKAKIHKGEPVLKLFILLESYTIICTPRKDTYRLRA